jgi:hypothetical protein
MAKQKREKAPATPGKTKHSYDATKRDGKNPDKNLRTAATVRRLKMYKTRPIRDKNGKMVYQELQSKALPATRIQPDRRWFGKFPSSQHSMEKEIVHCWFYHYHYCVGVRYNGASCVHLCRGVLHELLWAAVTCNINHYRTIFGWKLRKAPYITSSMEGGGTAAF